MKISKKNNHMKASRKINRKKSINNVFRYLLFGIALLLLLTMAMALLFSDADATAIVINHADPTRPIFTFIPMVGQDHYAGMWSCWEHPYRCLSK